MSQQYQNNGAPAATTFGKGERRGAMHGRCYGGDDEVTGKTAGSDEPPAEFGEYTTIGEIDLHLKILAKPKRTGKFKAATRK